MVQSSENLGRAQHAWPLFLGAITATDRCAAASPAAHGREEVAEGGAGKAGFKGVEAETLGEFFARQNAADAVALGVERRGEDADAELAGDD